jgi:hypothetical protein
MKDDSSLYIDPDGLELTGAQGTGYGSQTTWYDPTTGSSYYSYGKCTACGDPMFKAITTATMTYPSTTTTSPQPPQGIYSDRNDDICPKCMENLRRLRIKMDTNLVE